MRGPGGQGVGSACMFLFFFCCSFHCASPNAIPSPLQKDGAGGAGGASAGSGETKTPEQIAYEKELEEKFQKEVRDPAAGRVQGGDMRGGQRRP